MQVFYRPRLLSALEWRRSKFLRTPRHACTSGIFCRVVAYLNNILLSFIGLTPLTSLAGFLIGFRIVFWRYSSTDCVFGEVRTISFAASVRGSGTLYTSFRRTINHSSPDMQNFLYDWSLLTELILSYNVFFSGRSLMFVYPVSIILSLLPFVRRVLKVDNQSDHVYRTPALTDYISDKYQKI